MNTSESTTTETGAPALAPEQTATPQADAAATDAAGQNTPDESEQEQTADDGKSAEQRELERLRRALTKRDRTQGKLYQQLQQTQAELERLRQGTKPQQQDQDDDASSRPQIDPKEFERAVLTHAEQIAQARALNEKCTAVATQGEKAHPDFRDALKAVHEEVGGLFDAQGRPTHVMEQILDADAPAELLYHLGKNPELAASLDGLSPTKVARRLALIESQMKAKPEAPPRSSAPTPLKPVKAAGADSELRADLPIAEWMRRREAQLRESGGR